MDKDDEDVIFLGVIIKLGTLFSDNHLTPPLYFRVSMCVFLGFFSRGTESSHPSTTYFAKRPAVRLCFFSIKELGKISGRVYIRTGRSICAHPVRATATNISGKVFNRRQNIPLSSYEQYNECKHALYDARLIEDRFVCFFPSYKTCLFGWPLINTACIKTKSPFFIFSCYSSKYSIYTKYSGQVLRILRVGRRLFTY